MLYKNISDKAKIALVHMVKRRIQAGDTVNMSSHDINHNGSNMRFFEPVAVLKQQEVAKAKQAEASEQVNAPEAPAEAQFPDVSEEASSDKDLNTEKEEGESEQADVESEPEPETPTEGSPEPGTEPDAGQDEKTTPAEEPGQGTDQSSDESDSDSE